MAKKQKQEEEVKTDGWMATFSDLMNLLLCFFVMLFAMSTVDETKFEEFIKSIQSSFGIVSGASETVLDGSMVSTGTAALLELTEYYEVQGINTYEVSQSIIEQGKSDHTADPQVNNGQDTNQGGEGVKPAVTDKELQEIIEEQKEMAADKLEEEIMDMAEESGLSSDITMSKTANYVQITLDGATLFESGTAEISDNAIPLIDKIGSILKHYPDNEIEVLGHTDSNPIVGFSVYKDNIDLSFARAKNVAMYVVDHQGIELEKLKFSGRGEYEPVATNTTAEGRALNRRVEIRIYTELSDY